VPTPTTTMPDTAPTTSTRDHPPGDGRHADHAVAADGERFRQYRTTGDRGLRNEIIERHRWLALHCAKRFANKGEPLDDLIQVAMLGVLKAVERFDPDYGATFATFAVPTITGELRRHFRDTTWAVHVPRRAKDLQHTVKLASDELGQVLGRSPTVTEIADHAGVAEEDVLEAIEAARCYRKTPLVAPGGDDGDADDVSSVGAPDLGIDAVDAALTVHRLLAELPARERRIVELRYMRGLTQSRIAELVGVSQVQVSRLLRSSLARMNGTLEDAPGSCAV
jgi:RNA polymerase sigma-B factor